MKALKLIGKVVGIFILVQILLAILVPEGWEEISRFANGFLILGLIIGIVSLLLGGRFDFTKFISKAVRNLIELFRRKP